WAMTDSIASARYFSPLRKMMIADTRGPWVIVALPRIDVVLPCHGLAQPPSEFLSIAIAQVGAGQPEQLAARAHRVSHAGAGPREARLSNQADRLIGMRSIGIGETLDRASQNILHEGLATDDLIVLLGRSHGRKIRVGVG